MKLPPTLYWLYMITSKRTKTQQYNAQAASLINSEYLYSVQCTADLLLPIFEKHILRFLAKDEIVIK